MEKKRWSLIFMALFLALVFSSSSVEAQGVCIADDGTTEFPWDPPEARCDRDGDCYVKGNTPCRRLNLLRDFPAEVDCDDNDFNLTNNCTGDTSGDPTFDVALVQGEGPGGGSDPGRMACPVLGTSSDLVTGMGAAAISLDESSRSFVIFFNNPSQGRFFDPITWPGRNGVCDVDDDFTTERGGFVVGMAEGVITEIQMNFSSSQPGPGAGTDPIDFPGVSNGDDTALIGDLFVHVQNPITCPINTGAVCFIVHLDVDAEPVESRNRVVGTVSAGDLLFTRVE